MRTTHPYLIRLGHWLSAISIFVLATSGLQIFQAFPSFASKLPEPMEIPVPEFLSLGSWLGGALSWHFTFAWFFAFGTALTIVDLARGGLKRIWLTGNEWFGIWPMARYYFLRGPKPIVNDLYNPLQKIAYLSITAITLLALISGTMLAQPVQLGFLIQGIGGWQMPACCTLAVC